MLNASKPSRYLNFRIVLALLAFGAIAVVPLRVLRPTQPQIAVASAPIRRAITALGRIEPTGEALQVSAPTSSTAKVEKLLVKQGDWVEAEQPLAILDGYPRRQAALTSAQAQVKVAQARLAQVLAGAKTGEIAAQRAAVAQSQAQVQGERATQEAAIARIEAQWLGDKNAQIATINRLQAQLANAEAEFKRHQQLYEEGAISSSQFDSKRLSFEVSQQQLTEANVTLQKINQTANQQLTEARATLNKINRTGDEQIARARATLNQVSEVRDVDIQLSQAEVESALAMVAQAQAELDLTVVKAPKAGKILKLHTLPGEIVSLQGIVSLGNTAQMDVIAEVYETDIRLVKREQTATITSSGLTGDLTGKVVEIGLEIAKRDVLDTDPAADVDARVVEVKIRLDSASSERVSGLTNLQVDVAINL